MPGIKFAHLTDTHILCDYTDCFLWDVFSRITDPNEKLVACLENIRRENTDFVIITGDLVHGGTRKDYGHFKALLEKHLPGVPVLAALGNHDRKEEFYRGYLDRDKSGAYYYQQTVGGLRVVALDSSVDGKDRGAISSEQIEWLKDVLKTPAPRGTILIFHHPVVWSDPIFSMEAPEFGEAVKNTDVIGIFCGHTHYNNTFEFEGIPQIVGDSTAFAGIFNMDTNAFMDKAAYNLCVADNGKISVHNELVYPEITGRLDLNPKMVIEYMNNEN